MSNAREEEVLFLSRERDNISLGSNNDEEEMIFISSDLQSYTLVVESRINSNLC